MRIASNGIITIGAVPGSESLRVVPTASAVNYVQATGSATGNAVAISAQGSDTNISIALTPKGTGAVNFSGAVGVGTAGSPSYGTAGQVLTSQGSGSPPVWSASSGLPSQTGNAGKYLTTDGSTASWADIAGALATPTFTASTTTPASGATISVTITNYNAAYTYTIAVSGGSYTFNSGTGVISWTVPIVGSVTSASLTAFARSGVQSSLVGTQTVSVQAASGTDTISITNFASNSFDYGWTI